MENKELQEIWKTIDTRINLKPKDELNLLLKSKAKQTINKFLIIMSFSILSCIGLLIFITIASINRQDDLIYLINNITLGAITMLSLFIGLSSWSKLKSRTYNRSIKDWLGEEINLLSRWLTGKFSKLYVFVIPLLYILIVLSIHVYFENKPFLEVMHTEESVIGLIVAAPIGLFVSYYSIKKIRKYQLQNLTFLKDLHGRLGSVG